MTNGKFYKEIIYLEFMESRQDQILEMQQLEEIALERDQLKRLNGKRVIISQPEIPFHTVGTFVGAGINYLFLEDVKLVQPVKIDEYLDGTQDVDDMILDDRDFSVIGKGSVSNIYELYNNV